MPLHPAPTIDADLGLIVQSLTRGDTSHVAELTFAVDTTAVATPQAAIDAFQTEFQAAFQALLDNDVTLARPSIKVGDGTNVPHVAVASGATVTGSVSAEVLPSNVAVLIKKVTALGGKKNRGRTYVPWMAQAAATNEVGQLDPSYTASVQPVLDDFLADLATANIGMLIANKTLVLSPGDSKPHVTAITKGEAVQSYLIEPLVGTQRRRLGR